jgi:hypothetical protein
MTPTRRDIEGNDGERAILRDATGSWVASRSSPTHEPFAEQSVC